MHEPGPSIFALGGDASAAPSDTEPSYLGALAAGADGLAINLRPGVDGKLWCAPFAPDGSPPIDAAQVDAGAEFRSRAATGEVGQPWKGDEGSRHCLRFLGLDAVLRLFGRRAPLLLRLSDQADAGLAAELVASVERFGLFGSALIELPLSALKARPELASKVRCVARITESQAATLDRAGLCGAYAAAWYFREGAEREVMNAAERMGVPLWLLQGPGASLPPGLLARLRDTPVVALATTAVLSTVAQLRPRSVVFDDPLTTGALDRSCWAGGYSHPNSETTLRPSNDGLHVAISVGREYSGGGLVTRFATQGAFDAEVAFLVTQPQQATTFELAAIAIDPGHTEIDPQRLTGRNVNLTFDVHGAPPYASSERDEDNGFRFGWNNASNLTQILADWSHASANMYNKYGRDVGVTRGSRPSRGYLRLVRTGTVFASYYKDETAADWVCSGAGLVSSLPADAFLRIAAKHWRKGGEPPANEIVFSNFVLRQP